MKLKLKLDKRILIIAGIVILAVVAFLFRGSAGQDEGQPKGPLDAAAVKACDDFAAGWNDAKSQAARLRLADRVMVSTRDTENDTIADRAAEVGRSADDGGQQWKDTSAALTTACRAAGWTR